MRKAVRYISIVFLVLFMFFIVVGCAPQKDDVMDDAMTDYPQEVIKCVVTFGAGSVTDLSTRIIMKKVSEKIGQNIMIENLPGGGTIVGHTNVAKAKPDGYTIGIGAFAVEISLASTEAEIQNLDDLDVLAQLGYYLNGITVRTDSPWQSLDDLGKWGRENPGSIIAAPSATGSITHAWWELVANHYGIEDSGLLATNGGHDAAIRLLAGDADVISTPLNNVMEHVEVGNMRVLAVTTPERLEALPDVPTLDDLGVENPMIHNYLLIAPKGLPEEVREKLLDVVYEVLQDPDLVDELSDLWMSVNWLVEEELEQQTLKGREAIDSIVEAMS